MAAFGNANYDYATLLDDICDLPGVAPRRDVQFPTPLVIDASYDGARAPPKSWKTTVYLADPNSAEHLRPNITSLVRRFFSEHVLASYNIDPFGVDVRVFVPEMPEERKRKRDRERERQPDAQAAAIVQNDDWELIEQKDERKQYRHWAFTYPGEGPAPDELFGADTYTVLVAQRETASTGFHHWQGCVSFKAQRRFSEVRVQIHAAVMEKTGVARPPIWLISFSEGKDSAPPRDKEGLAKYRNYCRKNEDPKGGIIHKESRIVFGMEGGKVSRQGKRMDLSAFRELVIAKQGKLDICDAELDESQLQVMAKHPRFASELCMRAMYGKQKSLKHVYAFWGDSGTGKSTRAFKLALAMYNPHEVWVKPPAKTWWDGYNPGYHKCVVVDEYAKAGTDQAVHAMMLQVTDKTTPVIQCEVKGSYTVVDPECVIFTSILHPNAWIQSFNHADNGEQYTRRMTAIYECKTRYARPEEHQPPPEAQAAIDAILAEMPL